MFLIIIHKRFPEINESACWLQKRKQLRTSSQKELTFGKINITLYIVIKVKPLFLFTVEQQTDFITSQK